MGRSMVKAMCLHGLWLPMAMQLLNTWPQVRYRSHNSKGFEFGEGISMALLQFMCSVMPLARLVRSCSLIVSSSRTVVTVPSTTTTTKTKVSPPDSNVLLGMSEEQLQQLAFDFGQQSYRGKHLHHLLYKRRVKEIQEFSKVPLAFRTELQEAGWVVGRSSVHSSVVAADGTIKLLIKLEDNRLVETVGIPVADNKGYVRLTACVSSQATPYVARFVLLAREASPGTLRGMRLWNRFT
ncbi:hypothetical protein L6452_15078 [Arctium lappa]|uniref:Uncharacterized protein n=1 Tax=Arctium lappa TaxID=4217 RepID=A0ACB9CMR9_ARCLA|nr:hypothetical protein L6452_15078 [Arctium lappa]